MKSPKLPLTDRELKELSWLRFCELVTKANEKDCDKLLSQELNGAKRQMFVLRVHSRLNKLRRRRERQDLCRQARVS